MTQKRTSDYGIGSYIRGWVVCFVIAGVGAAFYYLWFVMVPLLGVTWYLIAYSRKQRKAAVAAADRARAQVSKLGLVCPDLNLRNYPDAVVAQMLAVLAARPPRQDRYRDVIVTYASLGSLEPLLARASRAVARVLASPE